jgi:hypothetical protein
MSDPLDVTRRGFLTTNGLVAFAAALGVGTPSEAVIIGDGDEKRNIEIVNGMCASWKTGDIEKVASYFADNIWFRGAADMLDVEALKGKTAIIERTKSG